MVLLPFGETNLILTGFTGRHQPSIGREIAARVKMPFVDIDAAVEQRAEMPLGVLRDRFGEARVKMLESEVVEEGMLRRGAVIRVSGPTLTHSNNLERLSTTGPVVCLVAALDTVLHRLHLQMGAYFHDPEERARAVGHVKREWVVRQMEGLHRLETTYMTEEEVVEASIALWKELV